MDASHAYIPLQAGQLISIDRETGATTWSIQMQSTWPPVVNDGVVYVAGGDQLLHAVRASDGGPLWSSPLAGVIAPLALQGEQLIALVKPDEVRALRTSDGHELWRRAIGGSPGPAAIATDATSVCVSFGSRLLHLTLADGALHWQHDLPGVLSPPALGTDRVFVGSTDNTFYAFRSESGRLAWRWRSGGDVVGAVADDRLVYVASLDNLLRALRRSNGNQVWKREVSTRTIAPPSTFDGIVVVSGNDPTMSTFDAATGARIAALAVPTDLQGPPLVDPVLRPFRVAMIAITRDGRAIGLRPTGMMFRERPLAPVEALPGRALEREPRSTPNSQGQPAPPSQEERNSQTPPPATPDR